MLLSYLTATINTSLREGQLQSSHKHAVVTPLLNKTGLDAEELKNYRPVSNLTFVSKLVERVVSLRLVTQLNGHGMMPQLQSVYRRHHSTETALPKVLSDVYAAIDCQQATLLGLLDLSATFDCVDYDILLRWLHLKFGICGTALKWMSSFLLGRSQQGQGTPVRQASAAFRSAARVCPRLSVVLAVYDRVIRCYHRVWVHRPLVCRRHTSLRQHTSHRPL